MKTWKVQVTSKFKIKFIETLEFISKDKPQAAKNFKKEALKKIEALSYMPFRNMQSIYFENENIRDLIFKGYTFIYEINERNVVVFSLHKHQIKP